jgi:hypothetical protein
MSASWNYIPCVDYVGKPLPPSWETDTETECKAIIESVIVEGLE